VELNEKLKQILRRAKETGDVELIEIASHLLNAETGNNGQDPPKKTKRLANEEFDKFVMRNNVENDDNRTGQPLEIKNRVNEFVDDGEEHKDEENVTPSVKLTERRRPAFKMTDQTCSKCNNVYKVHPQHTREFYVCDKCIRK
jgi:hypothetical protein